MAPAGVGGERAGALVDSNGDWEALWLEAEGPWVPAQDLALVAELFDRLDNNGDGVLQAPELETFRSAFTAVVAGEAIMEDVEEDVACTFDDVNAAGWASFHAAALASYGLACWRRGLESAAAVCRITRTAAPEEEEPWTISVRPGGDIICAWFSRAELKEDEREACRALVNAGGWRCLSCEAEALEPSATRPPPFERSRSTQLQPVVAPPALCRRSWSNVAEFGPGLSLGAGKENPHPWSVSRLKEAAYTRRSMSSIRSDSEKERSRGSEEQKMDHQRSWRRSLWRCQSLHEVLSHRALRPVRKTHRVGDFVIIESVSKGTAKKGDLGVMGTVTKIWVPENQVVKQEWCQVRTVPDDPTSDVCVPVSSVVDLKVPLKPGDVIEAFRPVAAGRREGERSTDAHLGTVLQVDDSNRHLVEVGFNDGERAKIRLSWVRRAEISAWTQVLRRAPYSTVVFLLFELRVEPTSPEDRRELADRIRRDFEPHGRFRYTGSKRLRSRGSERREAAAEPTSPKSPASPVVTSPSRSRLAIGDRGKILSFDLESFEAEVLPDRKKHLRMQVPIDCLEPDGRPLETVVGGATAMRAFAEDAPILASAKRGDIRALRALLGQAPRSGIVQALLEDNVDADGNTPFHAAVYAQSEEMFKCLWTAFVLSSLTTVEDEQRALTAANDWGRSVLWVALEHGNVKLCEMLLKTGAPAHQEAVVLPSEQDSLVSAGFRGGPGLVCVGTTFEVTLYTQSATSGLRFGRCQGAEVLRAAQGTGGGHADGFVVVGSFGEPAQACVMPGDVLLSVNGEAVSRFTGFRHLEVTLRRSPRPLTLRFVKGDGLCIRPLHRACELGHDRIAKLLVDYGADPAWVDPCGRSAMDRAVRKRNRQSGEKREPFDRCIAVLEETGYSEAGRVTVVDAKGNSEPFIPPAHWSDCPRRALEGRFWLQVEEETNPSVLAHFQRVMDRSVGTSGMRGVRTQDRKGEEAPTKLIVARAQRIENVASMREYLQRRHMMRSTLKTGRCERIDPDVRVKVSYRDLLPEGAGEVESPLDDSLNEVYLFHGTTHNGASGIAHENFQLSRAGSNAGTAFGRGIYFAEDCMKCDEYTKPAPQGHPFVGLRPVLLCRVLLGNTVVSEDNDTSLEVDFIMQQRYDSLIADRKAAVNTYREFIVFDPDQAYADYILWYWRAGPM